MITLLIPVDGSEASAAAARHAAFLFREGSVARVVLLNVQESLEHGRTAAFHSLVDQRELARRLGESELNEARDILEDSGVAYTAVIGVGDMVPMILRAAEASHCDGIVLGTTFWSRMNACFGGGLPARLMRRARVPVTLVRAPRSVGRGGGVATHVGHLTERRPAVMLPAAA
jgi:nucleotide-binding universal stress UspA family protein